MLISSPQGNKEVMGMEQPNSFFRKSSWGCPPRGCGFSAMSWKTGGASHMRSGLEGVVQVGVGGEQPTHRKQWLQRQEEA